MRSVRIPGLVWLCLQVLQAGAEPRLELGFPTGTITSLSADSRERFLVIASDDRTVRVFDLPKLKQISSLRLPAEEEREGRMYTAAIHPDGSLIAAGGAESRSIFLFDRASGKLLRRIAGLPHTVFQLAYSPDGRYLLAGLNGGGVRLYGTSGVQLLSEDTAYQGSVLWAAFSPQFAKDGLMATAGEDKYVRAYHVRADGRLELLKRRIPEQKDGPVSLVFSPDGRRLAVSLDYPDGYPEVEVWNPRTLAKIYEAIRPNSLGGTAESMAWSADGEHLYLAGNLVAGSPPSLIARLGKPDDDPQFETVRACGEQTECSIAGLLALKDGRILFASANQHGLGFLDAKGKVERFEAAPLASFVGLGDYGRFLLSGDGTAVRFSYQQDGREAAWFSAARGELVVTQEAKGFEGVPPEDLDEVRGLGTEHVLYRGKELDLEGEEGLRAIAAPGGGFLLSTQWRVLRFDAEGRQVWQTELPQSPEAIHISGDGRFAVAALIDGTLRWLRFSDGKLLLSFFPHPDQQRWVMWSPDGRYDASPGAEDYFSGGGTKQHGLGRLALE